MSSCNVRVVARFRPINEREKREEQALKTKKFSINFSSDGVGVSLMHEGTTHDFVFDRVYDSNARQEDIYNEVARMTIDDVLNGYNGTIFAYGQTGAGKTFTMFGPDEITEETKGIVPRAAAHIFEHINRDEMANVEFAIKCSFLEIYKEKIKDLLNPSQTNLKIRESPSRGVWVEDLTEEFVSCEEDIMELIRVGDQAKTVANTQMNSRSSRSHSIIIISIEQKDPDGSTKTGQLNLIDLAGSEKVSKTEAEGERLEEAKKINQSLSTLGNCIHALTENKRSHIPYRDSKLTRILQESLGGNTKTTLVIACSPNVFNAEETISTLRFGQRAKTIKNTVTVNKKRSVAELEALVRKLQQEFGALKRYTDRLEKMIEFMRKPDYDPKKGIPKELEVARPLPGTAAADGAGDSRPRTPKMAGAGAGAAAADGGGDTGEESGAEYNPLALAEAQMELQRLREQAEINKQKYEELLHVSTRREEALKKELEAQREMLEQAEKAMQDIKNAAQLEKETEQSKVLKLAKEKTDLEIQIEELVKEIATLTEQNIELTNEIAQNEENTLLLFQDSERLMKQHADLEREFAATNQALEEFARDALLAEKRTQSALEQVEKLKLAQAELEEANKKLCEELEIAAKALEQSELECVDAKATVQRLSVALLQLQSASGETVSNDVTTLLASTMTVLGSEGSLQQQIVGLQAAIQKADIEKKALQSAITKEQERVREITQRHEALIVQVQTLQAELDGMRTSLTDANKAQHTAKMAATEADHQLAELKGRITKEEENVKKLQKALKKETKKLMHATQQNTAHMEALKATKEKLAQAEDNVAALQIQMHSLTAELEAVRALNAKLSQQLKEEVALRVAAEEDAAEQRKQREMQLKRSRRIFKPVTKNRRMDAYAEKIDFAAITKTLKATGSKYLEAAQQEHLRSQTPRGEAGKSFSAPSTPNERQRRSPLSYNGSEEHTQEEK